MNDAELLRSYRETGSEDAFRELVTRHIGMVYATALGKVRNPDWADEVSHAVFIALARKAKSLSERTVLAGWLYRATRFAAGKLLRTEERRARHENEAAVAHLSDCSSEGDQSAGTELAPLVFEIIESLSRKDREAILLRFVEDRSFAQVAVAMGTSEAAAKMRTGRALEKLRRLLEKRGVPIAAAAISAGLTGTASGVPSSGLAASVTAAALGQSTASASAVALASSLLGYLAWVSKIKITTAVVGLLVAGGALTVSISMWLRNSDEFRANPGDVAQRKGWVVVGRNVWPVFHQGRQALQFDRQQGPGVAWREGLSFSEGDIEADIAAFTGHIGLAFWVQDSQHYSAVYFRPQNRPGDPVSGRRGVQYVALPEYGWERLRREKGGDYENSASLPAPDSGAWYHVRLEIRRSQVRAFIDNSAKPCLVINDVLTTKTAGSVGFFVGDQSLGIISGLKVKPGRK